MAAKHRDFYQILNEEQDGDHMTSPLILHNYFSHDKGP
jgi:hypothetical protein